MTYTVASISQTCKAPSQWEGLLDDGRHIYVRYRWGVLTVGVGDTFREAATTVVHEDELGDPLDGCLLEVVMKRELDGVVSFPS